jgi:shikimate kinase
MQEATGRQAIAANVVLTGFMGTGKTTVGRRLARRLGYEFVDTDVVIEQRHGPIPEIFRDRGEDAFRQMEREVAAELARRSRLVIATGGRLMVDDRNAAALDATGVVVCLRAEVDTILGRVASAGDERPLLAGGDPRAAIEELLAERRAAYDRFTPIDTDDRTPEQIVDEIVSLLGGSNHDV